MVLLEVNDLTARYHTPKGKIYAVENVSFNLNEGESLGIAGESACGKSTLGLSIMRMLQGGTVTSGSIKMDSEELLDLSDSDFDERIRWKKISMVFQGAMNSLDPVFTIKDQFLEILHQHNMEEDWEKRIHEAVMSVGLNEQVLKKYPHELSGGMKQRVVIAMALLLQPKLVIADEPTTALDVLIQAQIINLLKSLKKKGMSMIVISHDLAVLSEIADKIGIMYGGQMVEYGDSFEVYNNPKHPYTQALLDSIPTLKGNKPSYIPGNPPSLLAPPRSCRFIDRCPKAMEICKKDPSDFQRDSGYVRCWIYEETP